MNFKRLILAAGFALVAGSAFACDISEVPGEPHFPKTGFEICRTGYQLSFNPETHTPYWVMEHIESSNLDTLYERQDQFAPDPELPPGYSAKLSDYVGSGYARGHMAPAGDFTSDQQKLRESFYLSNMVPQIQKCNNSGIWSKIEKQVRTWAVKYGELYVVTGPIYYHEERPRFIGSGVRVPDALYKTIWVPALVQTLTFVVPNEELCKSSPQEFIVPTSELEDTLDAVFFPEIKVPSSEVMWR